MEAQQVINMAFAVFASLCGIIGSFVAWWVGTIWSDVKSQKKEIADLQIKLIEGYVPRAELEKTFARLFDAIDEIRKEIGHISRNQANLKTLQKFVNGSHE